MTPPRLDANPVAYPLHPVAAIRILPLCRGSAADMPQAHGESYSYTKFYQYKTDRVSVLLRAGTSIASAEMPARTLTSVDGRITGTSEARIPADDDGLLRGDGVFEVIRLYGGRPFALGEHLDRLERSAAAIDLPLDRGGFEVEIAALLAEFGGHEGQLRLVATRGGRRLAFTENLPPYAGAEAITLASVTYAPSVILNGVKSLSYAANMQASRLAAASGADEAVLVRPDDVVLEGPTSTVFWVAGDGRLRTPAIEVGILQSITRARIVG